MTRPTALTMQLFPDHPPAGHLPTAATQWRVRRHGAAPAVQWPRRITRSSGTTRAASP